ncbi:MAG TPA: hypothetical protein VFL42_01315, partial [Terriglobales bacterium]|nr:hypothetical protein [Terriglobales bacterium]
STVVVPMRAETAGSLAISFSSAPDGARLTGAAAHGALNLGSVSHGGTFTPNVTIQKHSDCFVVATRFAISLEDASHRVSAATVTAALASPEPLFTLRLDGVKLGAVPQMLQGRARVGMTTLHRLEIEVPNSVTEKNSQLQNAIVFQVIAN